jgi:hypothetical protein
LDTGKVAQAWVIIGKHLSSGRFIFLGKKPSTQGYKNKKHEKPVFSNYMNELLKEKKRKKRVGLC